MSRIQLYFFPRSGPCRGAYLAARAVGVPFDIKTTDLSKKEQLKPEFIKASGYDLSSNKKTFEWFEKCKAEMPGFNVNLEGTKIFGDPVKSLLAPLININTTKDV